jgi:phosphate transport system protein
MSDTLHEQIGEILEAAEREHEGHAAQAPEPVSRPSLREGYDRELRNVRDGILRMGNAVEDAINDAVAALTTADVPRAEAVVAGDLRINGMQREISTLITQIIATQQPVGRDLRFLLALDHVGYELERIGDHARSVARHAIRLADQGALRPYMALPEIGRLAGQQLHGILRSLVEMDEVEARRIAAEDDEIDARYHDSFDRLLETMRADTGNVEAGSRLLLVAHDLERIGDRVTNIAEDVVFLATGEIEDLNP